MSDPVAPSRLDPAMLGDALDALPDGVAAFDADWTVEYANPVAGQLLARRREGLLGRNLSIALPELTGTVFHSFLRHARSVGSRVTWQGFHAPADRWLDATALRVGERLHMRPREATGEPVAEAASARRDHPEPGRTVPDPQRLRFLAEVSEAVISTLDTGETVTRLLDLVVPQMCDWALLTLLGDDGQPVNAGRTHRDPDRLADLDTHLRGRTRRAATWSGTTSTRPRRWGRSAARAGERTLRWSSAGHLPPPLLHDDGRVEVLDTPPETLLGTGRVRPRTDHARTVAPGATLVFYTDGLVEQDRTPIDDGSARLTRLLGEVGPRPVDELCDRLLGTIVRSRADDDVALVAVRCHAPGPVARGGAAAAG